MSLPPEITDLRAKVVRLAAMVMESVQMASAALLEVDLAMVERVVQFDRDLDLLAHELEEGCVVALAKLQPSGADLRALVSLLRITHELERTGDLMVSAAKAARRLYPHGLEPKVKGLVDRMREQATLQLRLSNEALAESDIALASALDDMDDVMDDLQRDLFRAILETPRAGEIAMQQAVQMALVGRFFERAADHAVNIGARTYFMVTGELPGPTGIDPD